MARRHLWVLGQAAMTVVLLALLFRTVDVAALGALFARLPLQFYLVSLAVVLAGQIAYAWRWQLLLTSAGVTIPFALVVRQYFVGIFVNNFLPSSVGGDVAKVYYLGHDHGYRAVAASVVVDRLLGVGLLACLASGALWVSPISAPRLVAAQVASAIIAAASVLLLILAGVGTGGLAGRVARLGTRAVRLARWLQRLRLDMAAPLNRPAVVVQAAIVVVAYAIVVTAIYLRFVAVQNAPGPPFIAMFAAVTATTVLSNIPVSLNGLGLREHLHASLLAPLGIVPEVAVAISLLLYAHLVVASLIGLVFWLRRPSFPARAGESHDGRGNVRDHADVRLAADPERRPIGMPAGLTVVVLQPGYLPWLGFFDQLRRADVFVFYDDVQYDKHGWRNRNRIKTHSGPLWLTVPVRHTGRGLPRILDVEIDGRTRWAHKHVVSIRQAYARAPHLARYLPQLEELLERRWDRLVDLDVACVALMAEWLGLRRRVERSSELGVTGDRSERLVNICRHVGASKYVSGDAAQGYLDTALFDRSGISVEWQRFVHPTYPQLHGEFIPYLSALDLLLNCGDEAPLIAFGSMQ